MSLKDFLVGAGTAIVGVALGAVIVCCCCNKCGEKGDFGKCCEKQAPRPEQKDCQRPDEYRHCPKGDKPCVMKMVKELNLSDEQMVKVKALQKAKREAAIANRDKFQTEFENILNDEQKAKYNEIIQAKEKQGCPRAETPEMDE